MARPIRRPDFFLVGAPKCGTTAMHVSLGAHPQIFMSDAKETNHFATDLLSPGDPYRSRERYLELFRGAADEIRVGDASVFHLYSRDAAANIHAFAPRARILIMLRNPVEWLASYHAQMVMNGDEVLRELEPALAAEAERRRGERVPANLRFPQRLFYREVGRFSEQVERYFERFGREAVHVVLHDDLRRDAAAVYRETLAFLGVDPDFAPEFRVVNARRLPRSAALNEFLRRPPAWVAAPVTHLLPRAARRFLRVRARRWNARRAPRAPLPPALLERLCAEFRPEVERISGLLGRDLGSWCEPAARGA